MEDKQRKTAKKSDKQKTQAKKGKKVRQNI